MKFAWRTGAVVLGFSLGLGGVAEAAESGFYVGVALGVSDRAIGASEGLLFSSPFGLAFLESVEIDTDEDSFGWDIGYRRNEHFAAELAYLDFGATEIVKHYDLSPLFPFGAPDFEREINGKV
jgi:hypothetical protein